jgi:hypothetical protein
MDAEKLRTLGRVVAMHKQAAEAGPLMAVGRGLAAVPRIIMDTAGHAGELVTKGFAANPEAPGMAAKALGGLVAASPVIGVAGIGAHHYAPRVGPYLQTKMQQLEADQLDQMPYYDTQTQRFV